MSSALNAMACACGHSHYLGQQGISMFCGDPRGNCKCGGYTPIDLPPPTPFIFTSPPSRMSDGELQARVELACAGAAELLMHYDVPTPSGVVPWARENLNEVVKELDRRKAEREGEHAT